MKELVKKFLENMKGYKPLRITDDKSRAMFVLEIPEAQKGKPQGDPIADAKNALAGSGLQCFSINIFKACPRDALVLNDVRPVEAAKKEEPKKEEKK